MEPKLKPADIRPQLAKTPTKTSIQPVEALEHPDWVVERKWDGMRALFHMFPVPHEAQENLTSTGRTLIFTRNGLDLREQFPELLNLHTHFQHPAILDGEIIALEQIEHDCWDRDRESLELLQMRSGDKKAKRKDDIPVEIRFFDVLEGGPWGNVTDFSHRDRMSVLYALLASTPFDPPELLQEAEIPSHWEGVVVKAKSSTYKCDKRTSEWIKFKAIKRATLIATGLTPGLGNRADHFGAVLVEDANGTFRGQVGSGFSDAEIAEIESWGPWWDEDPKSEWPLIEVEYRFLSKTGLLVNTAYKGHRPDKEVADVL